MLFKINPINPQKNLMAKVIEELKNGGVIAYPTDTVYGIGCDIFIKSAVERVYRIKGRDKKKPLSFICEDLKHISQFAQVSDNSYRIMKKLIPGPYTFILKATKLVPKIMLTKRETVGIRVPDSEICRMLVRELGHPIVTTSANVSNEAIISDPDEIKEKFGKLLDVIIDSGPMPQDPSTMIDLTGDAPVVVREGKGDIAWIKSITEERPSEV
ncbi:MAG: L-threonylcarbamoyladenylate synthase [Myxococcota bacterium]|jgi:tRNA threonylcarbamoyl adenosine modification protein (Sua5/YciO/YrdC/YwlC family)